MEHNTPGLPNIFNYLSCNSLLSESWNTVQGYSWHNIFMTWENQANKCNSFSEKWGKFAVQDICVFIDMPLLADTPECIASRVTSKILWDRDDNCGQNMCEIRFGKGQE